MLARLLKILYEGNVYKMIYLGNHLRYISASFKRSAFSATIKWSIQS